MSDGGPYRSGGTVPRYVCIVCYRSLSAFAGLCRACGVDRLPLDEPEVREQVRLEAERRLERRMYREYATIGTLSAVCAAPFVPFGGLAAFILAAPVAMIGSRLYARLRKNSGIAVYARRRQRIAAELGRHVIVDAFTNPIDDAALARQADVDPATLDLAQLLAWLGARVDD